MPHNFPGGTRSWQIIAGHDADTSNLSIVVTLFHRFVHQVDGVIDADLGNHSMIGSSDLNRKATSGGMQNLVHFVGGFPVVGVRDSVEHLVAFVHRNGFVAVLTVRDVLVVLEVRGVRRTAVAFLAVDAFALAIAAAAVIRWPLELGEAHHEVW